MPLEMDFRAPGIWPQDEGPQHPLSLLPEEGTPWRQLVRPPLWPLTQHSCLFQNWTSGLSLSTVWMPPVSETSWVSAGCFCTMPHLPLVQVSPLYEAGYVSPLLPQLSSCSGHLYVELTSVGLLRTSSSMAPRSLALCSSQMPTGKIRVRLHLPPYPPV